MTDYAELDHIAFTILPKSLQAIYAMRYLEGKSHDEIGRTLHKSLFAVARLCKRIEEQLDDHVKYGEHRYGHTLQFGRKAEFHEDPTMATVLKGMR